MIRENTRQSDFLATVILNFKRRKLTFLLIAFFLSVVDGLPQQTQKVENRANSEKNDLDKSLDLLLESNLENRFKELNSNHINQPEKSSFNTAMMLSNPLPSQAEYDALIDLYQSTGGANWNNNSGWSTANPNVVEYVGDWSGIITDSNGHVSYLLLSDNNLVGTVPPSLEDLSNLYWLDFRSNTLSGDLEDWLGVFPNLTFLQLSSNSFTGTIPLDLGLNTNLTDVYLHRNQLSGSIPTNIGNLSSLVWLVLYDNDLTGSIPSQIGNLVNLQYLYLYRNNLSGAIPSTIGNMQALKFLGLHTNSFSGQLPSSIGNLSNLTSLLLQYNQFQGMIPSTIGNLANLQNLWLHTNEFSGSIPTTLGNLTNVNTFHAFENQLTGSIPTQIGGMSSLKYFRLNLNQLTGTIPSELGNLSNLEDMRLSDNQLSGSIPSSLCSLSNMVVFHAQMNDLSGDIPLCLLTNGPGELQLAFNYYYFTDLVNKTQYWSQQSFYSPQRTDPELTSYVVDGNGGITLSTTVGMNHSNASSYKWFKDDIAVTTDSPGNDTVTIPCPSTGNGAFNCDGRYVAEVTNPGYPTIVLLAEGGEIEGEEILQITICSLDKPNPTFKSHLVSHPDVPTGQKRAIAIWRMKIHSNWQCVGQLVSNLNLRGEQII